MAAAVSATLQNVYYERKTGTARPCYVCHRPTTTVLSTIKTEDFLYTCDGHLSDTGFATPIAAPPAGPTAEDIRKVVSEYSSREERKKETAQDKDKEKDGEKDKDGKSDDKDKDKDKPSSKPSSPPPVVPVGVPNAPSPATHRKFALHRSIFESRKSEMRRKEQTVRAKEVSKGLPQVPRGSF